TAGQDPLFYWGIAYALAISIDVMIVLLSVTVAQLKHQRIGRGTILSIWAFIILLTGLSWFINWQYARQFSSAMLNQVAGTHLSLYFFSPSVGQIDPVIASMFQVFAIAYTYIADKIAMSKPKTAAELKQETDEEEARDKELVRLEDIRKRRRQQRVAAMVGTIQHLSTQVQSMHATPDDPETLQRVLQFFREMPHLLQPEQAAVADRLLKEFLPTRKDEVVQIWRMRAAHLLVQEACETEVESNEHSEQGVAEIGKGGADVAREPGTSYAEHADHLWKVTVPREGDLGTTNGQVSDRFGTEDGPDTENLWLVGEASSGSSSNSKARASRTTGPRYLSFADAAVLTGYTVDTLKRMANEGKIKRHPSDKNRVVASTVRGVRNPKRSASRSVLEAID
ncbi:MAG TPA: sodium/calcium exchanger protein, partial [Ktedonobacteraceae bacterium]